MFAIFKANSPFKKHDNIWHFYLVCFSLMSFLVKITSIITISSGEEKLHVSDSHLASPAWKKLYFKNLRGQKKKKKMAIMPLKLHISAGYCECWVNQRAGFFPSHQPTHTLTHSKCSHGLHTNTHMHMLLDRNIHTLVDRAVHWGGLCFLSVGGRDEVMINMGDVWKCKSVLQHK